MLGFAKSVILAYISLVYIYWALLYAILRGGQDRLSWVTTLRFLHWHHRLEQEAVDVNFAIHLPLLDRLFGTYHLPKGRWPLGYGVPEQVPGGYRAQFLYPFRRKRLMAAKA